MEDSPQDKTFSFYQKALHMNITLTKFTEKLDRKVLQGILGFCTRLHFMAPVFAPLATLLIISKRILYVCTFQYTLYCCYLNTQVAKLHSVYTNVIRFLERLLSSLPFTHPPIVYTTFSQKWGEFFTRIFVDYMQQYSPQTRERDKIENIISA